MDDVEKKESIGRWRDRVVGGLNKRWEVISGGTHGDDAAGAIIVGFGTGRGFYDVEELVAEASGVVLAERNTESCCCEGESVVATSVEGLREDVAHGGGWG